MNDDFYMQRCLELAQKGMGHVSPNPMVGAVIVLNDKIIGEGYHQQFGQAHAEVNAINDVISKYGAEAPAMLKESTIYVNLEPCAHFGKTPPCADLIIRHQLKRVVIGNTDPFAAVNGQGIEKLITAGIEVKTNVLLAACSELNRRFFTRVTKNRPYIILKWAQTANGLFAPKNGTQKWITGAQAKQLNFKWRGEEDAIIVGKGTALIDNPELTNRTGKKNPTRILIDRNLAVPGDYKIYNKEAKTIIFNELKTAVIQNIHFVQMEDMTHYLPQKIAFQLYLMDIQSVIVEGGANLLNQFINANLWDEARVFKGLCSWDDGIPAPKINALKQQQYFLGDDQLTIYKPYTK